MRAYIVHVLEFVVFVFLDFRPYSVYGSGVYSSVFWAWGLDCFFLLHRTLCMVMGQVMELEGLESSAWGLRFLSCA